MLKAPNGQKVAGIHIHKGVSVRFVLTSWNLANSDVSQQQSNGDVSCDVYIQSLLAIFINS